MESGGQMDGRSIVVFIGAENIITPLGDTAQRNFEALLANQTGLKRTANAGNKGEELVISVTDKLEQFNTVDVSVKSINDSLAHVDLDLLKTGRTCFILSTTKGEITKLKSTDPHTAELTRLNDKITTHFPWFQNSILISNACISGVLAIVAGHDLIESDQCDTVIITGVDMLSEFTLAGFQSFFAISPDPCKPFDKNRIGINLGEGAATIILSRNEAIFKSKPFQSLGGTAANDANHISGPSRTGEGLFRSIQKTFKNAGVKANEVDFLSAHGTGTAYNDEMESIAFERAGLVKTPLHSLKGVYGHTFGAAGVIESAICLQSMRNNKMIASAGFEECGTSQPINVLRHHTDKTLNIVLKTASGFGGCNASVLFKK